MSSFAEYHRRILKKLLQYVRGILYNIDKIVGFREVYRRCL